MRAARLLALAAALLVSAAGLAGPLASWAGADGDPASDYLYAASAFVPYDAHPDSTAARSLGRLIAEARRSGYTIRVALIASREDLGSDTQLWLKPQEYASFLGTELSLVYHGELLVVMPDGLGVFHVHRSSAPAERLVQAITPAGGREGLERTAATAVTRLSAAAGDRVVRPRTRPRPGPPTPSGPIVVLVIEVLICLIALGWLAVICARRLRRRPSGRRRLVAPAALVSALVLLTGGGVAFAMLRNGRSGQGIPQATSNLMGLFHYPRGYAAPNFTLTDQRGHRYSLSSFRGHVVVLEFTDSHCKNLCPIISHEYVVAARRLAEENREVEFVSINANPYHTKLADVRHYSREHGLEDLPNWHFMTGTPGQLRAIWKRYGVSVTFNRKTREVEHEAPMLFIDRNGRERWLATPDENQADINAWGAGIALIAGRLL